ncbi:AP-2 complex subunit mu [Hibiscus syriacus]|uniref:AP-2 complex subunit mu n=1 Tax=Hibiscus syriacus TaxID=106335 RepID=A0A6A2ZEI1_HIBSY|nr:AP-2 complex subunit mu [Hibiscus syriacus]
MAFRFLGFGDDVEPGTRRSGGVHASYAPSDGPDYGSGPMGCLVEYWIGYGSWVGSDPIWVEEWVSVVVGIESRLRHLLLPPSIHFIQRATRYTGSKMLVAASAIYFLNLRGDVLINRLYRDDVGRNMVDAFRKHIMQTKELGTYPVRQIGGCSFFYMRIGNVYIVIVVSSNANVACAFKFVVEAVAMFKSYFGGAFDEDAIRNNFVLIYELLDDKPISKATLQVTGVSRHWGKCKLTYVFKSVLRCDVTGKILMKCFLSGMPDLKLGLNDKIGLEKESQMKSRPTKRWLLRFIPCFLTLLIYNTILCTSFCPVFQLLIISSDLSI